MGETVNLAAGALSKSGGVMLGGVRLGGNLDLPQEKRITGIFSDNTYREMLWLASDNSIQVGDVKSEIAIRTKGSLNILVNNKLYQGYHTGFKPTAAEVGAFAFHGGLSKDLNEIFSPGAYCNVYDAYATPAHHYPIAFAGSLLVYLNSANGWNGVSQEYRPYNSNKLFRRFYYVSSASWSEWSEEYNTHNKPTAADIGALSINELIGIPMPWAQTTAPSGWLKCNGQKFDKNTYIMLAKVYPSGILPDLRGEFIRGWDDGRQVDKNRGLLTSQQATIVGVGDPNINYTALVSLYNNVDNNPSTIASNLNGEIPVEVNDNAVKVLSGAGKFDPVPTSQASMYVRPRNIAFNYIVRAV